MVGDIKQSIYRFRNANPDIFSSKYNLFKENEEKGIVIDLAKNFRSRKEVLDNINLLFDLFMDDEIGGAEYQSTHQMIFGNMMYTGNGNNHQNNNLQNNLVVFLLINNHNNQKDYYIYFLVFYLQNDAILF